jgi:gliding motility-associated lipoprotein GldD
MMIRVFMLFFLWLLTVSCEKDVLPKPKAQLRLEYPENNYQKVFSDCSYLIEISQNSNIKFKNNCWAEIEYSALNASIHLTYRQVDNNLNAILREAEKLTYEHTIKADNILFRQPYENKFKKVYGQIVSIEGDVASNIQFQVTDSVKNLLIGALYFNIKPNYDSILPALNYVEKDIRNLMESLEWQN